MEGLKTQDEDERGGGSGHMEQLNAFKTLKDSTHGGTGGRLVHLIGNGLLRLSQARAQAKFG